jgi:hypothetical protein
MRELSPRCPPVLVLVWRGSDEPAAEDFCIAVKEEPEAPRPSVVLLLNLGSLVMTAGML